VQAVDAKEKVSRLVALRLAMERGTMIAGEPQPVQAGWDTGGTSQQNRNCRQWRGRAETSITKNHPDRLTPGVTPATEGRVACNTTSRMRIDRLKARIQAFKANPLRLLRLLRCCGSTAHRW